MTDIRRHRSFTPGDPPRYTSSSEDEHEDDAWNRDDVEAFRTMMDDHSVHENQTYYPFEMISDGMAQMTTTMASMFGPSTPTVPATNPAIRRSPSIIKSPSMRYERRAPGGGAPPPPPHPDDDESSKANFARQQQFRNKPISILTPPRSPRTKREIRRARGKCVRWKDVEERAQLTEFIGWACTPLVPCVSETAANHNEVPADFMADLRDESFYKEPDYFRALPLHPTKIDGVNDPILSFRERKLSLKAKARRLAASSTSDSEANKDSLNQLDSRDDNGTSKEDNYNDKQYPNSPSGDNNNRKSGGNFSEVAWKTRGERARSLPAQPEQRYAEIVWKSQEKKKNRGIFSSKGKNKTKESATAKKDKKKKKGLYQV